MDALFYRTFTQSPSFLPSQEETNKMATFLVIKFKNIPLSGKEGRDRQARLPASELSSTG